MCGIAGIYNYAEPGRAVDRDLLQRMTRLLAHRGPDDEGFHIDGPIGIGHRRLSIVDLSATGRQPMSNEDGSCWICYNGEFYNHAEFRPRLLSRGHRFRGPSDTETMLHLLEEDGPEALADVAGIFAFAFWDRRRNCLTLARDPLGVKQLYFHDDGERVVFASEIKALLVCPGVARDPDPEAINQYLHFHTALFERTFFREIHQLRAGEYMEISPNRSRCRTYWSIQDFSSLRVRPAAAAGELRQQLASVVNQQLMADVPVGSFFSGGIDSSSIAAYAARGGKRPVCFGVHFSHQGVIDERPYQEAAAKALNLDLRLITLDGSSFPDDMLRLLYHQDEPVIGAAMFPMAYVSRLAAGEVKVCLGGQGADEIFGGYARYALARPGQVIAGWFGGRRGASGAAHVSVNGNLGKQLVEPATLLRLLRNARRLSDWESSYFEHFAKVPESSWAQLFAAPEFYSRQRCRQLLHEHVLACPAPDPADKIMHWDVCTYLTGLFHQDDRMSMAASLESRVPMADPRLVRFAFRVGFDAKFRGGASKWILRQAVSDVLPQMVLTRRKVGFDTPAESWMKGPHLGFVRDLLLSQRSRERGFWNPKAIAERITRTDSPDWFDVLWKIVCIEAWASIFLDSQPSAGHCAQPYILSRTTDPAALTSAENSSACHLGLHHRVQEVRELGLKRAAARAQWEFKTRTGLIELAQPKPSLATSTEPKQVVTVPAPPVHPHEVAEAVCRLLSADAVSRLRSIASEAARGRILCFSRWMGNYGNPIDWHRNPRNRRRWPQDVHWSKVLRHEAAVGDVKLTWEAARFPQAFFMARAAAFHPQSAAELAAAFFEQIEGFIAASPAGKGVHWNSGQEIVLRLIAWSFGLHVFAGLGHAPNAALAAALQQHLQQCAAHLAAHIQYARDSVDNNHLISEALGLYLLGVSLPAHNDDASARMIHHGLSLLEQQAEIQFHSDGSYLMHSHNYHRAVLQEYLWAISCTVGAGRQCPPSWQAALERSLDFLLAQQNPGDGRLPNFGANDGSLPLPLSSCDFSDFRPLLQAISVATRRERVYRRGPWDEMALWLFGPAVLELPVRSPDRKSASFTTGGYHVLRGRDAGSYATLRCGCGNQAGRFSQIDMLHLDLWWRGHNVLADAGSYLYNGPQPWHEYFLGTGSHNTVEVDGADQMLHLRRFKNIYSTRAKLLRFEDHPEWALAEGEHYGFQRLPGKCVHRRSVLFVKDELWIVIDRIEGEGSHGRRLHWLGGDYPFQADNNPASLRLTTPDGLFTISTFDQSGVALHGDIVAGQETPPRGWISRYYGEKSAVPSFAVEGYGPLPLTTVSVLCPGVPGVEVSESEWTVTAGDVAASFTVSGPVLDPASVRVFNCVSAG